MIDKRIQLVLEWFKKADNDIRTAEITISAESPPLDTICFHCQQCAEKYLKGFLVFYEIECEKIHDLDEILDLCKQVDASFEDLRNYTYILNPFGVDIRYPENNFMVEYTIDDAKEAILSAKRVKEFVLEKLKDKIS
jgi:HEPN domain-containing protein